MAPIDSLTSAHAFTSFRPKSRGADFSSTIHAGPENWTGGSVTLLSPLAQWRHSHPGRWHRTPMASSHVSTAQRTKRPAGSPGNSPAASSRCPAPQSRTETGHRPWSANQPRASCASPPCNLHRHEHILRFVMLPEAVEISALQAAELWPGSPVHSSGSVGAGAATAAAARKESASRRPSSPPPPLRRLILSGPRRNGSNSSARRRLPRQHRSAVNPHQNDTLALFTNLFEEVSPQRKRGQRKKPKQNPFDSEEETEYESYTEEEGGGEGEDEGWRNTEG